MLDTVQLKPFAFGVMAVGLIWAGFAIKGKNDNLKLAQLQIDSARIILNLVKDNLKGVNNDINDTRGYLANIKADALTAKNDLSNLQTERDRIYKDINRVIDDSQRKLNTQKQSIDEILREQNALLKALDSIRIYKLIIESSKKQQQ